MRKRFLAIGLCAAIAAGICAGCKSPEKDGNTPDTFGFESVTIVQKSAQSYEFTVKSGAENPEIYITGKSEASLPRQGGIEYTRNDGGYTFTLGAAEAGVTSAERVKKLWIAAGGKSAAVEFSVPSAAVSLSLDDEGVADIGFTYESFGAWSALYKPSGKALYSSPRAGFDENATLVAEKLALTGASYSDKAFTFARPYYFAVMQARDDVVSFVTLPVRDTSLLVQYAYARLEEEDDKAYLNVEARASELTGYSFELIIREEDGEVFRVPDSGDGKNQSYRFDLTRLGSEGVWYDLLIGVAETGATYDLDAAMCDGATKTVDRTSYSFRNYEGDLKVTYIVDRFESVSAEMRTVGGKPCLAVTARMLGGDVPLNDIRLEIRYVSGSGKESLPAIYGEKTGSDITFVFDMTAMTLGAVWHDIVIVYKNVDNELPASACADTSKTLSYGGKTYSFKTYGGLLKITF